MLGRAPFCTFATSAAAARRSMTGFGAKPFDELWIVDAEERYGSRMYGMTTSADRIR